MEFSELIRIVLLKYPGDKDIERLVTIAEMQNEFINTFVAGKRVIDISK